MQENIFKSEEKKLQKKIRNTNSRKEIKDEMINEGEIK
jgi:hypothetical protein